VAFGGKLPHTIDRPDKKTSPRDLNGFSIVAV